MDTNSVLPEKSVLDELADRSGVAIAIVDSPSREISVSNNNSICRHLNPGGRFSTDCAKYCGMAFQKAINAGTRIQYECHAGLECRAVPITSTQRPLVAIVGRTFVRSDSYRKATERAITGDWRRYPPSTFFENILLTGSARKLDEVVGKLGPGHSTAETKEADQTVTAKDSDSVKMPGARSQTLSTKTGHAVQAEKQRENSSAESRAWRSFFGSLLHTDLKKASSSILKFISHHYGFSTLIWLERRENRLESTLAYGGLENRRVRLSIAANDERLIDAAHNEMPLVLGERAKPSGNGSRTMSLFPIGIDNEVSAAIATLDVIESDDIKRQIARICQSIAPQIEILRLRNQLHWGESIAGAVRKFSDSLKSADSEDFWLNLTQQTAEMLQAERASLLILDERSGLLEIKALVGARGQAKESGSPGSRVSRIVLEKNSPAVISDIARTSLPPAPAARGYKSQSFISCPISIGNRAIGVMNFTDRASGQPFDRSSLDLLQSVAPQLAVAIDRASLKEKAGEFEQLSVTDSLTGLLNRRYIEERLTEEVKRSNRHGFPMSFMMIDVDEFKSYNDRFGHPAGDEALKIVGSVIRETLRAADVAARFGGEEFSILLPQTTSEEAITIAERIRYNIEQTEFPHRSVTISIGVSSCSADLCSVKNIVSAADKALYEAKGSGRNIVRVYEESTSNGKEQSV